MHTGVDVAAPEGAAVFSALPGRVLVSAPNGEVSGYGQLVVVQTSAAAAPADRIAPVLLYAHLSARSVREGDTVQYGQPIGAVGRTAGTRTDPQKLFATSGAHLHLEVLSKWPPPGKDQGRLNVHAALGALGVNVPQRGPLTLACDPWKIDVGEAKVKTPLRVDVGEAQFLPAPSSARADVKSLPNLAKTGNGAGAAIAYALMGFVLWRLFVKQARHAL